MWNSQSWLLTSPETNKRKHPGGQLLGPGEGGVWAANAPSHGEDNKRHRPMALHFHFGEKFLVHIKNNLLGGFFLLKTKTEQGTSYLGITVAQDRTALLGTTVSYTLFAPKRAANCPYMYLYPTFSQEGFKVAHKLWCRFVLLFTLLLILNFNMC